MVMVAVATTAAHPPEAAMVLVTVYVPAVLPDRLTTPVEALILKPAVEVNTPATPPPLNVGDGLAALLQ